LTTPAAGEGTSIVALSDSSGDGVFGLDAVADLDEQVDDGTASKSPMSEP
jgi:hypothetical protein